MSRKLSFFMTTLAMLLTAFHPGSKINVVTTLPDLKSITEAIGGEKVDVFAIAT